MENSKARERLLTLLSQLKLTEDIYMSFFEHGELNRLTVHKKKRIWNFSLKLKNILPFQVYQLFSSRLKEEFQHIAQTEISITDGKSASNRMISFPIIG